MKKVSLEEAAAALRAAAGRTAPEWVELDDAVGRVSAQAHLAELPQPPFSRSPLDGYAVRAQDLQGANADSPAVLNVTATVYAGQCPSQMVTPGTAVRIMTGSMIPPGADCVVRQEHTDMGHPLVRVFVPEAAGNNICFRGEEYSAGTCLIPEGARLDAAAVAVLGGAGMNRACVRSRPRVGVVVTGDEVTPAGNPLQAGRIYDSNLHYLKARLRQLGAELCTAVYAQDDVHAIEDCLCGEAARSLDLIVTTGGISVGEKDLLVKTLENMGAKLLFQGVSIKPGMPTLAALLGDTVVLGLSGNPFSAAAAFELLIHPLFAEFYGCESMDLQEVHAKICDAFPKPSPCRRFLRGRMTPSGIAVPGAQANGQMLSMIGCNCLVDIPAGSPPVPAGQWVRGLMWKD